MLSKFNIVKILKGTAFGIAITAALLLISAAILCYTGVPGSTADLFVVIATIAGIIAAGAVSSCGAFGYGWLHGGSAGILYTLVLFVVSLFVCGFSGFLHTLLTFLTGFVSGGAGGIIGININLQKKRK